MSKLRQAVRDALLANEAETVTGLASQAPLTVSEQAWVVEEAIELVETIRQSRATGLMSSFLAEYGLTSKEGIALMCLAEALLRVPDTPTIDALISDKIAAANWGRHLGNSSSSLVNASTWALLLTGRIMKEHESDDIAQTLRRVVQRLGEPVVRVAIARALRQMGDQFVLGTTIESAIERGEEPEQAGYRYSYDMLGEAALTTADANRYMFSYSQSISRLSQHSDSADFRDNPGISVKLSALHPRYHPLQKQHIVDELAGSVYTLALLASKANMGFNIDAEEAERLDISLDVIEQVLSEPTLANWDGFGVVVQAYSQRAPFVIDWLYGLAKKLDCRIMVRLVKGAYWDAEIKRAQVLGIPTFPVFTRKSWTDLSYLVCARRLLDYNDRLYPQFATHNAHTVCSVLAMINPNSRFEFQRLHGMGEDLHELLRQKYGHLCRIYAPVGAHEDLLAYLVRRMLENGANSSFVHQLVDTSMPVKEIVADPIDATRIGKNLIPNPIIRQPPEIFGASRTNSKGLDLTDPIAIKTLQNAMAPYRDHRWHAAATGMTDSARKYAEELANPAFYEEIIGSVSQTPVTSIDAVVRSAQSGFHDWRRESVQVRVDVLNRIANEYEKNSPELIALMARETGKTIADGVSEVREAVDFCRYYASEAMRLDLDSKHRARGVILCISPWNFPLAIFTGQIAAALASGNSVIAKPAEQSPLTGFRAVELMYQAGVPESAVHFVPGAGETVGAALTADERIDGICFTGSTSTANSIHRTMAASGNPAAPLIAETGGLNAMIVDSTALPEQAVRDIVVSAFQSAGQRCSALRILYVQEEVKARISDMLFGAMVHLRIGDPWEIATDIGPVIDETAQRCILSYCMKLENDGRLLYRTPVPDGLAGHFVSPGVYQVPGIHALEGEVFGPVLHLATYRSENLPDVIRSINETGYGLTFGLHTRVDQRVQELSEKIEAGNIYVNRNQIGAVVGCQPFGGTRLSGTGPKAGGPHYVSHFRKFSDKPQISVSETIFESRSDTRLELKRLASDQPKWANRRDRIPVLLGVASNDSELKKSLEEVSNLDPGPLDLDGPTGESNRLSLHPKGVYVCVGSPMHVIQALATGNAVLATAVEKDLIADLHSAGAPVIYSESVPDAFSLSSCEALAGVAISGCSQDLIRILRQELAQRVGAIVQLVTDSNSPWQFLAEKSLCIDTTAAGGNAKLLLESGS